MMIPSIDLSVGQAVQLRQGKEKILERSDVKDLAREFSLYGDIAVIDLDAAMGIGSNKELILELCREFPCRVGGGIRDEYTARAYLKAGAKKIIIGTKAEEDFLSKFHREFIIVAVDARHGIVMEQGWREETDESVLKRIKRLSPYCSEFLFTQIESEGMMQGINLEIVKQVQSSTDNAITAAGGISSLQDIIALEDMGCNAQVGMAIYSGAFSVLDAFTCVLDFDKGKGLIPTIVQNQHGQVLMQAYSSKESLLRAFETRRGVYFSRSRNELWIKGESSGNRQDLLYARYDCDRDCLLFTVRQIGPACHFDRDSCFGDLDLPVMEHLFSVLQQRIDTPDPGSYTAKLLNDSKLLKEKLDEEMEEFACYNNRENLVWEAADVVYHMAVLLAREGVSWKEVMNELRGRMK